MEFPNVVYRVAGLTQPLSDRRDYGAQSYDNLRLKEWSNSTPGRELQTVIHFVQEMVGETDLTELADLPDLLNRVISNSQSLLEFIDAS